MKKLVLIVAVFGVTSAFGVTNDADSAGVGGYVPPSDNPAVGSIIHSFVISTTSTFNTYGVHRDASYVYAVMYPSSGNNVLTRRDPTNGSVLASFPVAARFVPRGEDHAHLGAGYLSIADATSNLCRIINTSNGSQILSFPVSATGYAMNVMWDGQYYYANGYSNRGLLYRYTTTGASAGTWTASGWPSSMSSMGGCGYATVADGAPGRFMVADAFTSNNPMCIINMATGSLVKTWSTWASNGQGVVVGPGLPSSWGQTAWATWYNFSGTYKMGLQIDIGGATAVAPASIGKVKAIYR